MILSLKKVFLFSLIITLIGLYLISGISDKIDFSNIHKFVQSYVYPGSTKNNSLDADGIAQVVDRNRIQYKHERAAPNVSDMTVNLNLDITNGQVTNRQQQNKSQNENSDNVDKKSPIENKLPEPISAKDYYKDPRNILPSEVDPIQANNVSWVTFMSSSEKERIQKELAKLGVESTELHSFKSPYIIDPRIYRSRFSETPNTISNKELKTSIIKKKIISCFACEEWMKESKAMMFNRDFKKCPFCEIDFKGKLLPNASAVIFFPSLLGKKPVPQRLMGQIWIMAAHECPVLFNYPASYNRWKSVFNWTLTYRIDSDIFCPYDRLAWRNRDLLLSDEEYLSIAKQKTKTAAWFVSHCKTQSKRQEYVKKLQEYIDVDIYGKCGNKTWDYKIDKGCEEILTKTYKFYLSFENSFCQDYVTEKLFRSYKLRTHVIPVTRGGFEYQKYIPSGGYVDAADFKSPKELGLYLKELGNDVNRYAGMLKEKDKLVGLGYHFDWCNICEKLHTLSASEEKIIPDIRNWSHDGKCYDPPGWKKVF